MAQATETHESQENELTNQVTIEDAGPAKKRLTITIPADAVDEKIDDSFTTLMAEAQLPGFRKGRAPRRLIERRFGTHVKDETRNQLVAEAYSKAIEEHEIRTVGDPEGDELEDIKVEPGKDLTFSVEVEVVPQIDLPELKGIKIKKPLVEVSDEHVEEELNRQMWRHGSQEDLTGEIGEGDRMQGHALVTDAEGEEISDMAEAVVAMPTSRDEPKGHLLGLFVENMFDLFGGKKVGDKVTYTTDISENDERPALRGKKVSVAFTIESGAHITPAEPEEIATLYGLENADALRAEIRTALEQRAEQEQKAAMREQVAEYLAEQVDFELPEKLSAKQAQRNLDRYRIEQLYQGVPMDEVEVRVAEIRTESEERSQRQLKLFFTLQRLAKDFGIQVTEQEINGRIAMIAAQRGQRPERLRAELAEQGRLQQIAQQVLEHKALDRVIDDAEVEEISADEWNKLVEKRSEQSEDGAS